MKKIYKVMARVEFTFVYAEGYGELLGQAAKAFQDGDITLTDFDIDSDTIEEAGEIEEPDPMTVAKDHTT